ncbi:hypothetical protein ACWDE9_31970 [Streptomyces olivaceoviridis]
MLRDPLPHVGRVYELTGPRTVDMTEMRYDRASADVERLTGAPAGTIEEFVAAREDFHPV